MSEDFQPPVDTLREGIVHSGIEEIDNLIMDTVMKQSKDIDVDTLTEFMNYLWVSVYEAIGVYDRRKYRDEDDWTETVGDLP